MLNFLIKRIKKYLIVGYSYRSGKNYFGRKTIFTQSGGYKFKSRIIDFKRNFSANAMLIGIDKDINFSGLIGLICYENGFFSYILLSVYNIKTNIVNGFSLFFKNSASTFIGNIPTGNFVHHIELISGKGGQLCRAAGCSAFTISKNYFYTYCKMKSGWLLKISNYCIAIPGSVSNEQHKNLNLKKAGKVRLLGFRPTVRGISKNPCDHPHGGGEGRGSPPRAHRTPWGNLNKVPTTIKKNYRLRRRLFKIFK